MDRIQSWTIVCRVRNRRPGKCLRDNLNSTSVSVQSVWRAPTLSHANQVRLSRSSLSDDACCSVIDVDEETRLEITFSARFSVSFCWPADFGGTGILSHIGCIFRRFSFIVARPIENDNGPSVRSARSYLSLSSVMNASVQTIHCPGIPYSHFRLICSFARRRSVRAFVFYRSSTQWIRQRFGSIVFDVVRGRTSRM